MLVCSQDMVPGGLWRTDRAKLAGNCVSTLLHSHSFTPIYSLSLLKKAFSSSGVPAVIKENHVHVCLCVCVCVLVFSPIHFHLLAHLRPDGRNRSAGIGLRLSTLHTRSARHTFRSKSTEGVSTSAGTERCGSCRARAGP